MVCSAMHKETGTIRAVKELKKSKKNQAKNDLLLKEFHILKTLDHPNILQMHGKSLVSMTKLIVVFEVAHFLFFVCFNHEICSAIKRGKQRRSVAHLGCRLIS